MNKADTVRRLLGDRPCRPGTEGRAFAPANIALCKYWGKRDEILNLPNTSSLSVSLGAYGAETTVRPATGDRLLLNGQSQPVGSEAARRVSAFLDLFRPAPEAGFEVESCSSVPLAAGLASSSSGFAALTLALDRLFDWHLDARALSILARLGSGSACRSLFPGFVLWRAGRRADGMDSYAEPLAAPWPELGLGLAMVSARRKPVSSREGMRRTAGSSTLYQEAWPQIASRDLRALRRALAARDLRALGRTAESNALAMHATMLDAWPPLLYWQPRTLTILRRVWALRGEGLEVYATLDAGPNVKLLYPAAEEPVLRKVFPGLTPLLPS